MDTSNLKTAKHGTSTTSQVFIMIRRLMVLTVVIGPISCNTHTRLTIPDPQVIQKLAGMPYPWEAQIHDLDIVVVRDDAKIVLTNRTPAVYREVQLWLNQEYVSTIDEIPIGSPIKFNLEQFINQHKEPFPTGGLLTPDKTLPVVLAELYLKAPRRHDESEHVSAIHEDNGTGKRYRLLVRNIKQ